MAHGLEARVPFLDLEMVDLAMRIDPALTIRRTQGATIEKWILRHAFEDLLPSDIVWRDKAQFDQGSGTDVALAASTPRRSQAARSERSPEEAWYRALFMDVFPKAEQALQVAVKRLPRNINDVVESNDDRSTESGTYGYACLVSDLAASQVKITSYGISNVEKATVISIVEVLPPGPIPPGVKAWNGWKQLSSIRSFTTVAQ